MVVRGVINPAIKYVIPAKAERRTGIQEPIDKTGFPRSRE